MKTRLEEVRQAVLDGASEIDIVINRTLALLGDWKGMMNKCKYIYMLQKKNLHKFAHLQCQLHTACKR